MTTPPATPSSSTHESGPTPTFPPSVFGSKRNSASPVDNDQMHVTLRKALGMLHKAVQPYLPLHREPGKHQLDGVDLVDQDVDGKPFNAIGIALFANHLLKSWEKHIDNSLKIRIESLDPRKAAAQTAISSNANRPTPKQLLSASKPHRPLSQPVAHALTVAKKKIDFQKFVVVGGGMIFIKEIYVRRLELENVVYRQHLKTLEINYMHQIELELRKEIAEAGKAMRVVAKPGTSKTLKSTVGSKSTQTLEQEAQFSGRAPIPEKMVPTAKPNKTMKSSPQPNSHARPKPAQTASKRKIKSTESDQVVKKLKWEEEKSPKSELVGQMNIIDLTQGRTDSGSSRIHSAEKEMIENGQQQDTEKIESASEAIRH